MEHVKEMVTSWEEIIIFFCVSTAWETDVHSHLENQRDIKEARREQRGDHTGKGK